MEVNLEKTMQQKIRKEATYFERVKRLEAVRQEYRAFLYKLENDQQLDPLDGRIAFINNTLSFLRSAVVILNILHQCSENDQFALRILCLSSPDKIEKNIKATNKFMKLSWCTQFQFQIEVTFKNILKELGGSVPNGYYLVCKKLLDVLQLTNETHSLKVLNIIAYIRNSQHANGIHIGHKDQDTKVIVDGILFEFKHGKMVKCATWDHIAHACINILPILKEVYYHDKVANISKIPTFFSP